MAEAFLDQIEHREQSVFLTAENILLEPYAAPVTDRLPRYSPPVMKIGLSHPDLPHPSGVTLFNPLLNKPLPREFPLPSVARTGRPLTYGHAAAHCARQKNLAYAIAIDATTDLPHNCPHVQSRYDPCGVCRHWDPIVGDWRRCQFPGWFVSQTNHLLDPMEGTAKWFTWKDLLSRRRDADLPAWWQSTWTPPPSWDDADWMGMGAVKQQGSPKEAGR